MERLILAALHLLALGVGLSAILGRWNTLRGPLDAAAVKRALHFDTQWGIAATIWIGTGAWRWLGSVEKTSTYYNNNQWFYAKMGTLVLVFAIEVWPMLVLTRWRRALARGATVDQLPNVGAARTIADLSSAQAILVVAMVFFATAMARGFGMIDGRTLMNW